MNFSLWFLLLQGYLVHVLVTVGEGDVAIGSHVAIGRQWPSSLTFSSAKTILLNCIYQRYSNSLNDIPVCCSLSECIQFFFHIMFYFFNFCTAQNCHKWFHPSFPNFRQCPHFLSFRANCNNFMWYSACRDSHFLSFYWLFFSSGFVMKSKCRACQAWNNHKRSFSRSLALFDVGIPFPSPHDWICSKCTVAVARLQKQ